MNIKTEFQTNISGKVRNTKLPKRKALWPLFEIISNSIHAIEERGNLRKGIIEINIIRNGAPDLIASLDEIDIYPINSFRVSDNGIGFTDSNFKSFLTAESEYKIEKNNEYQLLLNKIGETYSYHKSKAVNSVNKELLASYWKIGEHIVNYEQKGKIKAEYGKQLLIRLAKDLKVKHGKGFSRSNLYKMRQFYQKYPKIQTVSGELTWSHYVELLNISDDLARNFYQKQTLLEGWSVRELKRQKKTALFQRLALSKEKEGIIELSNRGHQIKTPDDLSKDPYVFEFLGFSEEGLFKESELENKLLNKLQQFLLELGKGFAFIGRQYRVTLNNNHFRVDLVFYHYILKCFVLIDLKVDKLKHHDIGQMNLYINYFKAEENRDEDNEPIGIILTTDKDEILVEYATGGLTNQLFVSKYQIYLPDKKALKEKVREILERGDGKEKANNV